MSDPGLAESRSELRVVIGGAGYSYRELVSSIGGKVQRVKIGAKDESRFTIKLPIITAAQLMVSL